MFSKHYHLIALFFSLFFKIESLLQSLEIREFTDKRNSRYEQSGMGEISGIVFLDGCNKQSDLLLPVL